MKGAPPHAESTMPLVLWDERALVDWDAGMRAAVYAWLGSNHPAPSLPQLGEALARAEAGARASQPGSFMEMLRRIYLSLGQDLAFAPRPLDILDLEQRLCDFFPRPHIAAHLRAIRRAGFGLGWLGEAHAEVASIWRARIGVPFDTLIELMPQDPFLGSQSMQTLDVALGQRAQGAILVQHEHRTHKGSAAPLSRVVTWPPDPSVFGPGMPDEQALTERWREQLGG